MFVIYILELSQSTLTTNKGNGEFCKISIGNFQLYPLIHWTIQPRMVQPKFALWRVLIVMLKQKCCSIVFLLKIYAEFSEKKFYFI